MTGTLARQFPDRSTAMLPGFGRVLDRASLAGGLVVVVVAAFTTFAARSAGTSIVWAVAAAGLGTLAGLAVACLLMPAGLLRAFEAFSWLGRSEIDRFSTRTGSKPPTSREAVQRWLVENPPSPATDLARVELLAFIGRLDEAHEELKAVVRTGPDLPH